jgi:hypothetical protein
LNTDNDPVHALLSRWRDDPAGTYRTWFLWEERLKNFRSIRRGIAERALRLIKKAGVARPRDLEAEGVTRALLSRLVKEGLALRQGRGIYVAARHAPSEAHTLAAGVSCTGA